MAKHTITIDTSDEEHEAARIATTKYREQISETPALLSLLYDIDLLPEQIKLMVNATRMAAVCKLFKCLTPEAVASLFDEAPQAMNDCTPLKMVIVMRTDLGMNAGKMCAQAAHAEGMPASDEQREWIFGKTDIPGWGHGPSSP